MPRSTTEAARGALAYVGIGANLGDVRGTLDAAFVALAGLPRSRLCAASSLYRTAPVNSSGPDYLNAVVALRTGLTPHALLDALQRIESDHQRQRPYRNAPRTLDLDLLLYGRRRIHTAALTVPHPRLHQRAFVLDPLHELDPRLEIPGRGAIDGWRDRVAGQAIARLPPC